MGTLASVGSLVLTGVGTGLSALGAAKEGSATAQQYLYQAQVAANNAAVQRENAKQALASGQYEESASKLATGQLVADQKAAQAANGLDVNVGSPVDVRDTTRSLGAMDAAMIHFNAAREAFGYESEASNLDTQSSMYAKAAKGAKSASKLKIASTLIGGASSLASKWSSYKQSGAMGGGTVEPRNRPQGEGGY